VKRIKSHSAKKAVAGEDQKSNFVNPFIQMMEDKAKIAKAFKKGEPLNSLEDIKFAKSV
jgi:hypothetical protein